MSARPVAAAALAVLAGIAEGKPATHPAPKPARTLAIESVDRAAARAVVLVGGARRAPEARLFTFHDDRDRHFIALGRRCEPAGALLRCVLELPRSYLSARVLDVTVHLGGREVHAPKEQIESAFGVPAAPTADGASEPRDAGAPADGGVGG